MKYISKGTTPSSLKQWIRVNAKLPGAQYGSHDFPTAAVRDALLFEQGNLCAYTMVRLDVITSHIEHIKPQALSQAEHALQETWDYTNLLACYPGDDPAAVGRNLFGATKKGDHWDQSRFLSPLEQSCESRIRFSADGGVSPTNPSDRAAAWTIDVLGLDSKILGEWRQAAIDGFGVSLTSPSPLSRAAAERLRSSLRQRRSDGRFISYCIAVEHAAKEYVSTLDRLAKRRRFSNRSRMKKST